MFATLPWKIRALVAEKEGRIIRLCYLEVALLDTASCKEIQLPGPAKCCVLRKLCMLQLVHSGNRHEQRDVFCPEWEILRHYF